MSVVFSVLSRLTSSVGSVLGRTFSVFVEEIVDKGSSVVVIVEVSNLCVVAFSV